MFLKFLATLPEAAAFDDERYAGPIKTKYYFAYRKLDKNK
jgi:hypothetical protein